MVLGCIAAAKVLFHLLLTGRYGYFRDELYFLACGEHLAWGYVDHPPLSIAVLAVVRGTLGDSLFALRLLPILAGAVTIVLTGLIAREMGARRWGQAMAALAACVAPNLLAMSTYFSMNCFEQVLWPLAAYVLIRLIKTDDSRLWVVFGAIVGLALLNKLSTGVFGVAVVIGLLATRHRKYFLDRWLYIGGATAVLVFLPHLLWQIHHGWPFLDFMAGSLDAERVDMSPWQFFLNQATTMHPFTLPIWLIGVGWLLLAKPARPYRVLGIIFVVVFAAFLLKDSKDYYVAPVYPMVFAAGATAIERFARARKQSWVIPAATAALFVGGAITAPLAIPILPPQQYTPYAKALGLPTPEYLERANTELPQHLADRFGWENMVATVAEVYKALPFEERTRAAILAANWGEAGAIDFFGKAHQLPKAICPNHSYWYWGPRDATGEIVVAVGFDRKELKVFFGRVEEKARVVSPFAHAQETNLPVFLCREPAMPIGKMWAKLKSF
jgi:hypothetical protein